MHIYYSAEHLQHDPAAAEGAGFPLHSFEVPARTERLLAMVQAQGWGPILPPTDFGLAPILATHSPALVEFLRTGHSQMTPAQVLTPPEAFAVRGVRHRPKSAFGQMGYFQFGADSPLLAGTWAAAYASAQCALSATQQTLDTGETTYALCRPPGHHAAYDIFGGYCYLNNVAIAANYAREMTGGNVAILDIDFHHGNGTQELFYESDAVLYCSLHGDPDGYYPFFWGGAEETGAGAGKGFNRNWPLPPNTGDAAYIAALEAALAVIGGFQPRVVLVSVGFDIAVGDEVGGFLIETAGFAAIAQRIAALKLPTVLVQEGGYRLDTLAEHAAAFLGVFAS